MTNDRSGAGDGENLSESTEAEFNESAKRITSIRSRISQLRDEVWKKRGSLRVATHKMATPSKATDRITLNVKIHRKDYALINFLYDLRDWEDALQQLPDNEIFAQEDLDDWAHELDRLGEEIRIVDETNLDLSTGDERLRAALQDHRSTVEHIEDEKEYKGPQSGYAQAEVLSAIHNEGKERAFEERLQALHKEVLATLRHESVRPQDSFFRLKGRNSILQKLLRRTRTITKPIPDIYGITVVIQDHEMIKATNAIGRHWPTPRVLPWGLRSIIGRPSLMKFDPFTGEEMQSRQMFIQFDGDKIAEIQLLTEGQVEVDKATRKAYEEKMGKDRFREQR
ncbi:MAG: hypothetical protein A2542_03265 [Parcubacteria group bacterium RIFOXYD2_FULL_52_8]|nr:MAG: hypothetical protein A2542_03265 [Parcubacteria group bacterium RIFOXYD2_FULL_52_8]